MSAYDLDRFLDAQEPVIDDVMAELRAGRKQTHWMWFIFPQLVQLGRSTMANHYGIDGLGEAAAYLAHPLLRNRLETCTGLVIAAHPSSALAILGTPDDLKFRSCSTLFAAVPGASSVFAEALALFYDGPDAATLALLSAD